jgi:hypothetical protein
LIAHCLKAVYLVERERNPTVQHIMAVSSGCVIVPEPGGMERLTPQNTRGAIAALGLIRYALREAVTGNRIPHKISEAAWLQSQAHLGFRRE